MTEKLEAQFIKGNDTHQDEFIDFINYVFHMNGKDEDFYRMLPKLYKRECHPCEYNYLALEKGMIKAAVGSFPGEVIVSGIKLNYCGIGNVSVNPYSRSKGYMKKLMNMAIDDMLSEDVDFSVLGGRRNRYAYFSYELVGRKYNYWLDESNIKHMLGKDRKERFKFVLVHENDKEILQAIADLQTKQPVYYRREEEKHYDILKNWRSVDIYGIYDEMRFAGYLLNYDKNNVREVILHCKEDISEVIADFVTIIIKGGLNIELADYQRYFIDELSRIAENVSIQDKDNFSVFHYGRVIEAYLRLKAETDRLADGEITFFIHGVKMDERLLISVNDGKVSVTPTDLVTEYEYSHLEAMSILFQNYSSLRSRLPFEIQSWLPLPIYVFPADEV